MKKYYLMLETSVCVAAKGNEDAGSQYYVEAREQDDEEQNEDDEDDDFEPGSCYDGHAQIETRYDVIREVDEEFFNKFNDLRNQLNTMCQ